jgi:monoamine oxidase
MTEDDWTKAHTPLGHGKGQVFFAGEAWCRSERPYTQGAFLSGQRVVDKWVLPAMGRPAGPVSLCDKRS